MEGKRLESGQSEENLTADGGRIFPIAAQGENDQWVRSLPLNLRRLVERNADGHQTPTTRKLTLEQLEIFEAELRNQRILPLLGSATPTLTQDAQMEANLLRWRARRAGFLGSELQFRVDLERYTGMLAVDLMKLQSSGSEKNDLEQITALSAQRQTLRSAYVTSAIIAEKLLYLDALASYLLGGFDAPQNKYQAGLNLILKILSSKSESATNHGVSVVFPVTHKEFLSLVRAHQVSE